MSIGLSTKKSTTNSNEWGGPRKIKFFGHSPNVRKCLGPWYLLPMLNFHQQSWRKQSLTIFCPNAILRPMVQWPFDNREWEFGMTKMPWFPIYIHGYCILKDTHRYATYCSFCITLYVETSVNSRPFSS